MELFKLQATRTTRRHAVEMMLAINETVEASKKIAMLILRHRVSLLDYFRLLGEQRLFISVQP
jgi:hypothetical protein